MRLIPLAAVLLILFCADNASASRTVCSNPNRVRVFDRLVVAIPNGDEPAFASAIRKFDGVTDMSLAEVIGSDKHEFRSRRMIFQSPKVSVVIHVDTEWDSRVARISIERTCYNDALEEWKPYWSAFRTFLEKNGLRDHTNTK